MWVGSIKIRARPFWGRGVFVLVISNINIGFQKSLTLSLIFSVYFLHSIDRSTFKIEFFTVLFEANIHKTCYLQPLRQLALSAFVMDVL